MKIKDILEIIEQNEDYKQRIETYKIFPETQNIAQVLEHNYKKWLEMEISECEPEKYNQLKEQLKAKEQECEELKEEVSYLQCKWRIKCLKKT